MNHDKVKEILFDQDSNLRDEYNALQPIYEIRRQLIQYRIEQGLSQKELAEKVGTGQRCELSGHGLYLRQQRSSYR
jgi:DNA-directed RNA polymerase specialized sigma subunit